MSNYEPIVRTAIAVMRLVVRAVMEQMFAATGPGGLPRGGILIIDEAHVLMGSEEGRSIIERLGREGRSQRVLPILATQRVADVTEDGADLGSYLSRLVCLKMSDRREATASLKLLKLDPTEERIETLANAGPTNERPALAYHRDLRGRCSLITIGPIARARPQAVQHRFARSRGPRCGGCRMSAYLLVVGDERVAWELSASAEVEYYETADDLDPVDVLTNVIRSVDASEARLLVTDDGPAAEGLGREAGRHARVGRYDDDGAARRLEHHHDRPGRDAGGDRRGSGPRVCAAELR